MKRPFNEELITAYLDGELTAEEQSQVEQALASDTRLRRMHDDLRGLRTRLQSLPQQTLDAGFAERVLRAAVARRQAPAPAHEGPEVLVKIHHGDETTILPAQHEPLAWRVILWSVAGLAAAILLVLFLPDRTSEFASRIKTPVPASEPQTITQSSPATGSRERSSEVGEANAGRDQRENSRALERGGLEHESALRPDGQSEAAPKMMMRSAPARAEGTLPPPAPPSPAPAPGRAEEKDMEKVGKEFAPPPQAARMALEAREPFEEPEVVKVVRLRLRRSESSQQAIDAALGRAGIGMTALEAADSKTDNGEGSSRAQAEKESNRLKAVQRGNDKLVEHKLKQLKDIDASDIVYLESTAEQFEAALKQFEALPDARVLLESGAAASNERQVESLANSKQLQAPAAPAATSDAPQAFSAPASEAGGGAGLRGGGAAGQGVRRGVATRLNRHRPESLNEAVQEPQAPSDRANDERATTKKNVKRVRALIIVEPAEEEAP